MNIYEGAIISCDRRIMSIDTLWKTRADPAVGDDLPAAYRGAPRELLGERSLIPCFGDTHLHFASYALFNAGLDVSSARSLPEMGEHIREFARENGDPIVMGFGASAHSVEEKTADLQGRAGSGLSGQAGLHRQV